MQTRGVPEARLCVPLLSFWNRMLTTAAAAPRQGRPVMRGWLTGRPRRAEDRDRNRAATLREDLPGAAQGRRSTRSRFSTLPALFFGRSSRMNTSRGQPELHLVAQDQRRQCGIVHLGEFGAPRGRGPRRVPAA